MNCRQKSKSGFTLVELMIFIALVGILSALFIPPFLNYLKKVKSAEAELTLSKIADLEIAYFKRVRVDEFGNELPGRFLACEQIPEIPTSTKKTFIPHENWKELGFEPKALLYYAYEVKTRGDGLASEASIFARGDLDDDGLYSTFSLNLYIDEDTHEIKKSQITKVNELE